MARSKTGSSRGNTPRKTKKATTPAKRPRGRPRKVEKPAAGRPAHVPTDERRASISLMVAFGIKQAEICKTYGITPNTLRKHYKQELEIGQSRFVFNVGKALYLKAVAAGMSAPSVSAAQFLLKQRGGPAWREPTRHEFAGPGGGAIPLGGKVEVDNKVPQGMTGFFAMMQERMAKAAALNEAPEPDEASDEQDSDEGSDD